MTSNNPYNLNPTFFDACLNTPYTDQIELFKEPLAYSPSARSRLSTPYPQTFTDFYGTPSRGACIYKTGPPWSKPEPSLETYPFHREMRPIHGHPITSAWRGILKDTQSYLDERGVPFTALMGFGFANEKTPAPFCRLLFMIGVPPDSIDFPAAKTTADYVQRTILTQAGFPDIEVAVREWTVNLSGGGPKLPTLDILLDPIAEFRHPFASTLGLSIAQSDTPDVEGTVALYLRHNDNVLAITTAHVARPKPIAPINANLPEKIIALGPKAHNAATTSIMSQINTLHCKYDSSQDSIHKLGLMQGRDITDALERINAEMKEAKRNIGLLDKLHSEVTKLTSNPIQRHIGFVLHVDPTVDWAAIQLSPDAFDWAEFQGNKLFIGGNVKDEDYRSLMFPHRSDRAISDYPGFGLLQVSDHVPESEIRQPTQRNVYGDSAMPVIKNGSSTGTTVGWVNGLDSLVRYPDCEPKFETTILSYGGSRSAFSDKGDSGAIVLDRGGRIVAMLRGEGGSRDVTDVSYGTAWYDLEPHIHTVFPGYVLYPLVLEK